METPFPPTELDLALERDPVCGALNRDLADAATKEGGALTTGDNPPSIAQDETSAKPASRHGQTEIAAASLAAGMIAAEGRPVTAAEAVQKVRDVLEEIGSS